MGGDVRRRLQVAIAVGATVLLVVIGLVVYPRVTTIVPDRGGAYVEAVGGEPQAVNPLLAKPDTIDSDLARLIFDGLTKLDDRGRPVPSLARSWTVGAGAKTYTFALRDDVQWHDGAPLTADDVAFTIRLMQDPAFPGNPELGRLWQGMRVDVVDPRTIRLSLTEPYAPILEFASIGILPAHLLRNVAPKDLAGLSFGARPVGTGHFRVKAASRDELLLEANDKYFGSLPYLQNLRFRFYRDDERALAAFRRQEVQGLRRVAAEQRSAVQSLKNANLHSMPDFSKLTLLLFNTKSPLFGDKSVRQAIAYSLNRQALIDNVLGGAGVRADGPVLPVSWAYKNDLRGYDYRPEAASALLDAAGWVSGADGVRARGIARLSFVLLTNDNPARKKAAAEIARQLTLAGFAVEVQTADWPTIVQDSLVPHKFQAVLAEQWSPNFDPDPYAFWHSSQIATGLNFASWTNRRADELIENARQTSDELTRRSLYDEFQGLFVEELPAIPLFYPLYDYPVDRGIRGVRLQPMVESADRFNTIGEWFAKTKTVAITR